MMADFVELDRDWFLIGVGVAGRYNTIKPETIETTDEESSFGEISTTDGGDSS